MASDIDKQVSKLLGNAIDLVIVQAATRAMDIDRARMIRQIETLDDRLGVLPKEDIVGIINNTIGGLEHGDGQAEPGRGTNPASTDEQ